MSIVNQKNKYIAFIYTSLPAYFYDCIKVFAQNIPYKIVVVETSVNPNYPLEFSDSSIDIIRVNDIESFFTKYPVYKFALAFISGWANKTIVKGAKIFHRNSIPIILLSDLPIKHNLKQFVSKFILSKYLKIFSHAIVSGKLARDLLIKYGMDLNKISLGLYTANDLLFNQSRKIRAQYKTWPKFFLFDGQHIHRKGFKYLINEYINYRKKSSNPWNLIVVGKGPLDNIIPECIKNLGFVNPYELPNVYASAGCLVLPSYDDNWPLVVHQAACAGLPLIISRHCGNHYEFLQENVNGYLVDPHKKGDLVDKFLKIEQCKNIVNMGELSYKLSQQYSISSWLVTFLDVINKYACAT